MSDTLESLRVELHRLTKLIEALRAEGHTALATMLDESVAACLAKIEELSRKKE